MDNNKSYLSIFTGRFNSNLLLIVSLFCIGILYLSTLISGQIWSGDFAQYIHHAQNLAEGRHYSDTHYLTNTVGYFVGPYNYPPIYPLLITPICWLKGLDIEAMKWVGNCFFMIAIWLAIKCFQPRMKIHWALPVLLIAFNPYIWSFRNNVMSDFPFTFFSYLTLLLMLIYFERDKRLLYTPAQVIPRAIIIGVCCYLCFGTREIGVVLPLTFLTYDIIGRRRLSLATIIVWLVFISLSAVQKQLLSVSFVPEQIQANLSNLAGHESSVEINHLKWVSLDPHLILKRVIGYRYALQDFWILFSDSGDTLARLFIKTSFNLTTLLALAGYIRCLINKITPLEIFMAGYIAVLLLFGAPPTLRYLIPLFPLFIYYTFLGIQWLSEVFIRGNTRYLASIYFLLTITAFLSQIPNITYEIVKKGVYNPETIEMFNFIKSNSKEGDTLVFRKPRILALYTQRTTASYPNPHLDVPDLLDKYFDAIEGDYYIAMNLGEWMLPLESFEPPSPNFRLVFRNTYFAVFHYEPDKQGTRQTGYSPGTDAEPEYYESNTLIKPRQTAIEPGLYRMALTIDG